MTTDSVELDVARALALPGRCPTCGDRLDPVRRDLGLDLACRTCGSRWHLQLGRVTRVAPGRSRWSPPTATV